MSEQTAEATETGAEATEQQTSPLTLPDDHPLVRTLAEQKKAIKELKAKAQRLDEIEESQKTEAEKTAERLAQAEAKAQEAERRALRFEIAAEFGLSGEGAKALEHVSSEDGMREVAKLLAAQADQRKKNGNHVPREGDNSRPPADDRRAFADFLTGRAT